MQLRRLRPEELVGVPSRANVSLVDKEGSDASLVVVGHHGALQLPVQTKLTVLKT